MSFLLHTLLLILESFIVIYFTLENKQCIVEFGKLLHIFVKLACYAFQVPAVR